MKDVIVSELLMEAYDRLIPPTRGDTVTKEEQYAALSRLNAKANEAAQLAYDYAKDHNLTYLPPVVYVNFRNDEEFYPEPDGYLDEYGEEDDDVVLDPSGWPRSIYDLL